MDQATRNSLQNATQQARRLLEREITEQLEGTFDVLPNGTIADKPGKHLDASQRLVRTKIVESIRHRAGGSEKPDMLADAVADYVREAAFTILNRYIALKMLEVRGLVQQCITKGDQSSGFKEFGLAATGLAQLPDKGYRLYLESLFDELSTEVKILFDRHSDASLLWPRRQAFDGLLEILNADDLGSVWKEDETIGWVYQYFNSQDERRAMREASSSPRNSRELAVRNQFFTPRYVVQFLTDNTLGRIWYEMRQGHTALVEQCRYLVRDPTEVFLQPGVPAPTILSTDADQPRAIAKGSSAHILFREKKDPRDLKVLDPACGSSHFLLYCFDLLLTVYEEAWSDERSPESAVTGRALRVDYPTIESLHVAVPGLILRHNVHGIDIDPRCAQIGAFALWMRAQRAYGDFKIPRDQRPPIRKSNIVVAEPMPGEEDLLKDFLRGLRDDRLEKLIRSVLSVPNDRQVRATAAMADSLCELVRTIWTSMKLAGEAGSLLRMDKELEEAVAAGREEWEERLPLFRVSQYGLDGGGKTSFVREVPGEQADFWAKSEALVLHALRTFASDAEQADRTSFRRGLFAEDAARGLAFIDHCALRFDVVLMNPPFGEVAMGSRDYLYGRYASAAQDIFAAFVERGLSWLVPGGRLGALTSRLAFFAELLESWRRPMLGDVASLGLVGDLGYGVLDDALVEAAAYVIDNRPGLFTGTFLNLLQHADKSETLLQIISALQAGKHHREAHRVALESFHHLPACRVAYWVSDAWRDLFRSQHTVRSTLGFPYVGIQTGDDELLLRLTWEVPAERHLGVESRWIPFAKGGEYSPVFGDYHLVVDWSRRHLARRQSNASAYLQPGITWTERTTSDLSARVLPPGCAFSPNGVTITPQVDRILWGTVLLNSRPVRFLIEMSVGSGDAVYSGSAARHYGPRLVANTPVPALGQSDTDALVSAASRMWSLLQEVDSLREESHYFTSPFSFVASSNADWSAVYLETREAVDARLAEIIENDATVQSLIADAYGLSDDMRRDLDEAFGVHPCSIRAQAEATPSQVSECLDADDDDLMSRLASGKRGSRSITKKTFVADRRFELLCNVTGLPPKQLARTKASEQHVDRAGLRHFSECALQYALGCAFDRWTPALGVEALLPLVGRDWNTPLVGGFVESIAKSPGTQRCYLVDEPNHPLDVAAAIEAVFLKLWPERGHDHLHQAVESSVGEGADLRTWLRSRAFADHISRYSNSRRSAPVLWQLGVRSMRFSVWVNYQCLHKDAMFKVLKDVVRPRCEQEENLLSRLRSEAGASPTTGQRRAIEEQEDLLAELHRFDQLTSMIAPLWDPNHNDGVRINAAILWPLFAQNSAWQKECKSCWQALCNAEYDWTYLAIRLWPERVIPRCVEQVQLAMCHGLDGVFWEADTKGKWTKKKPPVESGKAGWQPTVDRLVAERTNRQVKDALAVLLAIPTVESGGKRGRKTSQETTEPAANGEAARNGTKRKGKTAKSRDESEELF